MKFEEMFKRATGNEPYPYQNRLAESKELPQLLDVPTGCGKTAAVVLAWLWRRRFADEEVRARTPRRLVYCLPMRVLVEQTRDNCVGWLEKLDLLGGNYDDGEYTPYWDGAEKISVTVLMGGEDKDEWDLYPERDAIIIGTQDMLLSRALNRGYGMSRYRWPVHYGLLNNDSLWVMDEVQLMGVGVETSSQLDAFRTKFKTINESGSLWMSATVDKKQLETVDQKEIDRILKLTDEDNGLEILARRKEASKPFERSEIILMKEQSKTKEYYNELSSRILDEHINGTLTLVIMNTVDRAQALFKEIQKDDRCPEKRTLLHSRFRKPERDRNLQILDEEGDRLIISTQVVEAGVDIDSTTLFTELAPWPSMVQRFGRCNRKGLSKRARIFWIDMEDKLYPPYGEDVMDKSREIALELEDVGLEKLEEIECKSPVVIRPVIRKKDVLELFDTTPDLSGNDLDISRYIREGEDKDVQVFWRDFDELPDENMPRPVREELCSVSIAKIAVFLKKKNVSGFVWDPLDSQWVSLNNINPRPGQIILLDPETGGYEPELGWTGKTFNKGKKVEPIELPEDIQGSESNEAEETTHIGCWETITEHSDKVTRHLENISKKLNLNTDIIDSLKIAAKWHDVGKAHEAFQNKLFDGVEDGPPRNELYAKSDSYHGNQYFVMNGDEKEIRKHFRHELASALTYRNYKAQKRDDLSTYLIAAHHGKVRQSIRSLPGENEPPQTDRLFARGIWDGDTVPSVAGLMDENVKIDLSPMVMGKGSWLEMSLGLLSEHGPFKLAYLEALMKASDEYASKTSREAGQ